MTATMRLWDDLTEQEQERARMTFIHGGPGLAAQGIIRTVPRHGWCTTTATDWSVKQGIVDEICMMIGVGSVPLSTGSTEVKRLFVLIDARLGLGLDLMESKPVLCEMIAMIGGETWGADCDSRDTPSGGGSTITLMGLLTIRDAVATILERRKA